MKKRKIQTRPQIRLQKKRKKKNCAADKGLREPRNGNREQEDHFKRVLRRNVRRIDRGVREERGRKKPGRKGK